MKIKSEKLRNILMMATLILVTIAMMGDMVIIPIVSNLYELFADVNVGVLNYILSGPALIAAFTTLAAGKLMEFVNKKLLLLICLGIFGVGAIFGFAVENAYYVAVMRTLVGVGLGGLGVVSMAILADAFADEEKRGSMIGIYNGGMAAVGALMSWIAGIVASYGWTLVFKIYLVIIPVFVLVILFIPSGQNSGAEDGGYHEENGTKSPMPWKKVILTAGAFLVYNLIYGIIYYQISMIVVEKGIGDVSLTGILSALGTVGSFVACSLFGVYYRFTKRFTPVLGFLSMAACYTILFFSNDTLMTSVACTLLGATYGLGMSYYLTEATVIVTPENMPMSISVVMTASGIGMFLSVYAATLIQSVLGIQTITGVIPVLNVILITGAVLSFIFGMKEKKNSNALAEN